MTPHHSSPSSGSLVDPSVPALVPALQASDHIQREHLLTIFEHVPAGIVYMDPAGRVLAVNPMFEQYVARPAEIMIGERFVDLFPEAGASLQILIEEVSRSGRAVSRRGWRFLSGSDIAPGKFWDYSLCATHSAEGAVLGLLLLITDVSDRVAEQERIREEAADQVVRSERLSTLGTLASAIGHELRNPLGIIQNAARTLGQRSDDAGRVQRLAGTIEAEAKRATKVITDLLDFVRVRSPRRHSVGIPGLVQETIYRVGAPESVRIECELEPELPLLMLDGQQMAQVLENLIRNALEAMPNGGVIRIQARLEEGTLALAVIDDGPGILPEELERIFEPLFTTKRSGTGIGLAISRRLVEAHGGGIGVESEPGRGAIFTIRLPLLSSSEGEP